MPLTLEKLQKWRGDMFFQNNWRYETAQALDYYDGNQYDSETAQKMEAKGIPLIFINVSKPLIDTAIGLHERNLTDWVVKPEDDVQQDVGDVLTGRMKETERATNADRIILDATATMLKGGIAWVEAARNSDPFQYKYRVTTIPYTDMWTDPRSIMPDYSDSEYIRRIRFFEMEHLQRAFPKYADDIRVAGSGDYANGWYEPQQYIRNDWPSDLTHVSVNLWGANRRLVAMEEVQYRTIENQHVFRLSNGRAVRFDPSNPMHVMAYEQGVIQVFTAPVRISMQEYWIGSLNLMSRRNPAGGDRYTWVPFVAERENRTGAPYGLMRNIIPMQDEINTRRAKAAYAMQSYRVIADKDYFDDPNIAREEVSRRDAFILLNEKRRPNSKGEIQDGVGMSKEQYAIMDQTMSMVPQVSGIPLTLQGVKEGSVDSGVAIQSLGDFGINTLARTNAHAREARRKVGEILLNYEIQDMGKQPKDLQGKNQDGRRIQVTVNKPMREPNSGATYIDNDLTAMNLKVVLDDVQHTPTHRTQIMTQMLQALRFLPPQAQSAAMPWLVEMSDLPPRMKKEMANDLRKALGQMPMPDNEQEAQQMQEQKAHMQAAQQDAQAKEEQLHQVELAERMANAQLKIAQAGKMQADTARSYAGAHKDVVQAEAIQAGASRAAP